MKIYIKYENENKSIDTEHYQSIKSIINTFFNKYNINNNIDDFFIDYNGIPLDNDLSLEKYNISDNSVLNINEKKKGGNSFMSFASKNPGTVILCLLISLLPILILPFGFISLTSSLIKIIMEKSINSIGKYLVCRLGKITLFSRIKILIFIFKYIIFILMVYVIITLPLILLCVTIKGYSVLENPKNMCSPLNVGSLTGLFLTLLYMIIYLLYRSGNLIIDFLIKICKKVYILNVIFVPLFKSILLSYNQIKYIPSYIFVSIGLKSYYEYLKTVLPSTELIIGMIIDLGCKKQYSKEEIKNTLYKKFNESNIKNILEKKQKNQEKEKEDEDKKDNKFVNPFSSGLELCDEEFVQCCNATNYINLADVISNEIEHGYVSIAVRSNGLYPSIILMLEALYESALTTLNDSEQLTNLDTNSQKIYLRKILQEQINKITDNTKKIIKKYLESGDQELIEEIDKDLNETFKKNYKTIDEIKYKLAMLEENMINYAKEDGSKYTPGKSLFKTLYKFLFLDIFCNVSTTAKSSRTVIKEMGEISEIIDMIMSSTATGLFMSRIYIIVYIIIIICGIFNVF
jgi:hypothetical protein